MVNKYTTVKRKKTVETVSYRIKCKDCGKAREFSSVPRNDYICDACVTLREKREKEEYNAKANALIGSTIVDTTIVNECIDTITCKTPDGKIFTIWIMQAYEDSYEFTGPYVSVDIDEDICS